MEKELQDENGISPSQNELGEIPYKAAEKQLALLKHSGKPGETNSAYPEKDAWKGKRETR